MELGRMLHPLNNPKTDWTGDMLTLAWNLIYPFVENESTFKRPQLHRDFWNGLKNMFILLIRTPIISNSGTYFVGHCMLSGLYKRGERLSKLLRAVSFCLLLSLCLPRNPALLSCLPAFWPLLTVVYMYPVEPNLCDNQLIANASLQEYMGNSKATLVKNCFSPFYVLLFYVLVVF